MFNYLYFVNKMRTIHLVLLLLLCAHISRADKPDAYTAIDKKMLEIPASQTSSIKDIADYINANFTTQPEKVRAAFIWTASNIDYDVENMYAINFHEKRAEKIDKALKTHKGICENYAAIFNALCSNCGLRSYVIVGYNKWNGSATYIPHAWCAAVVDSQWYLFDPTWGAGYIQNEKFIHRINNDYFKALPTTLIRSHMPFDPLWELLNNPITNQEFYEGKTVGKAPFFSFPDSIAVYDRLGETDQMEAAVRRIEQNGIKNGIIYDWLANLKRSIEINKQEAVINTQNEKINIYNDVVAEYNNGINDLNSFINYRNVQFTPKKTDPEIQAMMDTASNKLSRAKNRLDAIKDPHPSLATLITSLRKSIVDAMGVADEQQEFLKKYFSKPKLLRKSMFYKYTWMGIPIN